MVVYLIFYAIDIHTVIQRIYHTRLRVILLYTICLDHLVEILLSDLIYYLIFTPGLCINTSALWDFCVLYFLTRTHLTDMMDIYRSPFNLCNGLYPKLIPLQLNATQYQCHLAGFIALPSTWSPL